VRQPVETDPLRATETWFLEHGLSYFVPEERAAAREALAPRRTIPLILLVGLAAAGAGAALAWFSDELSFAPATLVSIGLLAALAYALTALRARPIATWALHRTLGSLRLLLSTASRALPLLLVFVTFLFINAEAWQMTSRLPFGRLWLVVLLLMGLGIVFLLVRLPHEVDLVDDAVDEAFLTRACAGTPLEEPCRELLTEPGTEPATYAQVTGFDRWNLILVLLIIQFVQVLVLVVAVFAFFLLFGSLVTTEAVQVAWTGLACGCTHHIPYFDSVSAELVKVSLFLAAFSGLYFTVSAVTDETYREQFFSTVMREMERAVGVRAVYLALRARTSHRP
jgi:hypothetical protein